jgi:hypothetical protein
MKSESDKLPVSRRALLTRINRKLAKDNKRLVFDRTTEQLHLIDLKTLSVVLRSVDLAALGAKLDVIKGWETVRGE